MSDIRPAEVAENSNAVLPQDVALLRANFEKQLRSRQNEFLLDVEFEVPPGFTILFGASGAGKTTLLDCLAGLIPPDSGRISLGERILFDSSQRMNIATARRRVGYVFQSLALFPHMTVEQNVEYGAAHLPHNERSKRVTSLLGQFRISHLCKRRAANISGGESQRV